MQYIFEKMFDEVVKSHFSTPSHNPDEPELTSDEHNALRYVAGYVPHALITKISASSHPYRDLFVRCHSNMGYKGGAPTEEENFQEFTKRWITAVNRGGLFFVKDEVYLVFSEMETKIRKHLAKLVHQRKLDKAAVIKDIVLDDEIQFY